MAVVYCKSCRLAFPERRALRIAHFKICPKCKKFMIELVGDEYALTEKAVDDLDKGVFDLDLNFAKKAKSSHIYRHASLDMTLVEALDHLRHDVKDVKALITLGKIYFSKDDAVLAKVYFQKALALEPDNEEALEWYAKLDPQKASEENIEHLNIDDIFDKCVALYQDRQYEQVESILVNCLHKAGKRSDIREMLSSVSFELGKYDQAIKHLNFLKGLGKNLAFIEFNLGVSFYAQKKYSRALACFKEAFSKSQDEAFSNQCESFIQFIENQGSED